MQTSQMNAIITTRYGAPEVLKLDQVPVPTPKGNEIIVKIHATSVTAAQMAMRTGKPYIGRLFIGLRKPNNPIGGTDFAGEVVSIGKDITKYKVGDAVFGATDADGGTYAEYVAVSEDGVVLSMPQNTSFEEASAIIEGFMTAYAFLKGAIDLEARQKILINGASGSIGTAAVQIAKYIGAEVTGVSSATNTGMVSGLGADHVIDYMQEDFTQNGVQYDVIFDTVGKSSFKASKNSLTEKGRYLSPVLRLADLSGMMMTSRSKGKRLIFSATGLRDNEEKKVDFGVLKKLLEEGKIKAVIDRTYQLPQAVEAHRYVEKGHKKGNVVLVMEN